MFSKVSFSCNTVMHYSLTGVDQPFFFPVKSMETGISFQRTSYQARKAGVKWSFIEGSRLVLRPQVERICSNTKGSYVSSALIASSQIASTAFTWGTVAVLPFYTLMVIAPRATFTKKLMESDIPFGALGILYGCLLYLSWTPETLRVMFATKYLLPELPGITKMFANEMTMASAWIHLLAVDLFAARQVFHDGLKNNVETRHSVSLCLLCCPIGILSHVITKGIAEPSREEQPRRPVRLETGQSSSGAQPTEIVSNRIVSVRKELSVK
ncbi:hypothetical protein KSP39_PZI007903 [Platanthera zijinensis]|uniref:Protein ABA DEFICIENT 4, chloroplastic n=1 Tax=Platanthera zijinensis TaxID=2320716 RepID=A0AAP0G930_9ASPA